MALRQLSRLGLEGVEMCKSSAKVEKFHAKNMNPPEEPKAYEY